MNNLIEISIIAILQNLVASFLAVVLGIAFTQLVRSRFFSIATSLKKGNAWVY